MASVFFDCTPAWLQRWRFTIVPCLVQTPPVGCWTCLLRPSWLQRWGFTSSLLDADYDLLDLPATPTLAAACAFLCTPLLVMPQAKDPACMITKVSCKTSILLYCAGNIRVALHGSQRKSLRSMKNASPKMRFKPCVVERHWTARLLFRGPLVFYVSS